MNPGQAPIHVLSAPPLHLLISSTPGLAPFPEFFPSAPTLPSPLLVSAVPGADPTYMTKVFGLGGGRAAVGGHRGGAGGGILLQATGLVQPIFRRGVCRADTGCRRVLRTQVRQRCAKSCDEPESSLVPSGGDRLLTT